MTLFQQIRWIREDQIIVLLNINGQEIFRCRYKSDIPSDLLDQEIFNICVSWVRWANRRDQECAFIITLKI